MWILGSHPDVEAPLQGVIHPVQVEPVAVQPVERACPRRRVFTDVIIKVPITTDEMN